VSSILTISLKDHFIDCKFFNMCYIMIIFFLSLSLLNSLKFDLNAFYIPHPDKAAKGGEDAIFAN